MTAAPPKVFISYSHDNEDHAARVLNLTNGLRRDGVDAIIDQYLTSLPEGWPAWMDAHFRDDDFVIMVCTQTYYRRVVRKEASRIGLGIAWEGSLIYNHIYRDKCDLSRFLPVLLNGGSPDDIPDPLFGATYYLVETRRGYKGLLRQVFKRPEAQMPDIGEQAALPQHTAQWTRRPPAAQAMPSPAPPTVAPAPEPVPSTRDAVSANRAVRAPVDISVATSTSGENKWTIVIEASFEDIGQLIPLLTNKLRELSGDATTLSIKRVLPGSVVLELECSNKVGLKLYGLIADGELSEILGYKVHSIAITPLIAALHDPDKTVRKEAAEVLGKLGDTRAVEPLIAALKDNDWKIRRMAAEALGEIGDARAVQPLIDALKDENWKIRWDVAYALGQLGDARAVQQLIDTLKDNNAKVHWAAAYALGQLGTAAVQPLIDALKDDNPDVRRGASKTLGKIGDARAVQPLIDTLKDNNGNLHWAAAYALGQLGTAAVQPLIDALKDNDKIVRSLAAEALGQIGDVRAVQPLIDALKDDDKDVRRAVDQALRNLGSGPPPPDATDTKRKIA